MKTKTTILTINQTKKAPPNRWGAVFGKKISLLLTVAFFALAFSVNAQVFIKQNATGSGSGSNWNNAAGASALENAISQGGIIYIAAGTYTFSETDKT